MVVLDLIVFDVIDFELDEILSGSWSLAEAVSWIHNRTMPAINAANASLDLL